MKYAKTNKVFSYVGEFFFSKQARLPHKKLKKLASKVAGKDGCLRGGEAWAVQLVDLLTSLEHHGGVTARQDEVGVLLTPRLQIYQNILE